jgi:hypothetical protein
MVDIGIRVGSCPAVWREAVEPNGPFILRAEFVLLKKNLRGFNKVYGI